MATTDPDAAEKDVRLSSADLERIVEALDSHVYWQLSDPYYRNDGYVRDPGSDEPEKAEEIEAVNELHDRLEQLSRTVRSAG